MLDKLLVVLAQLKFSLSVHPLETHCASLGTRRFFAPTINSCFFYNAAEIAGIERAEEICATFAGAVNAKARLAVVDSAAVDALNHALATGGGVADYWIALYQTSTNVITDHSWRDGTSGTLIYTANTFANPVGTHNFNGNSQCVRVKTNGQWSDSNCNDNHPHLCELYDPGRLHCAFV